MTTYTVTLVQSPNISEAERQARINRAFDLLLSLADENDAADGCEFGDPLPSAAHTPAPQEAGAQLGGYTG